MLAQYNPFKENRAEQMKDLWKYYIPLPGIDYTGKPLVVVGGRGSGKTMLFMCNSWRQEVSKIKEKKENIGKILKSKFIGIYYRVDTTFVSAMAGNENIKWSSVFETYFSICILKEILCLLVQLNKEALFSSSNLEKFIKEFSIRFGDSSQCDEIQEFQQIIERHLDHIEDIINGIVEKNKLRMVNANRFIDDLFVRCNNLLGKEIQYKIFIDEYETLQQYQQKIINTLIKHSTLPVIFNIGLRPEGMKTKETVSQTEVIEAPHDYEELTLAIDSESYLKTIKEICRRRIELGQELGKIPKSASTDIEYYLGMYSMDEEMELIVNSKIVPNYISDLRKIINKLGQEEGLEKKTITRYIDVLCDKAPYLNSKLHYLLLFKKTQYSPSLSELYNEFIKNSKRYKDWVHNRKFGIIFLLARDFKKEKMYYGLNVYIALSSNIVRYFLELCERAFIISYLDDYKWNKPITPMVQTEAAKYVSEYKVLDIIRYEPYGRELRIFTQYLGQLFYFLHMSPSTTLGEPEQNHFSTKDLALSEKTRMLLSSSIMWNVLQAGEPTKRKNSKLSPETVDFHLNKIYAPYFGISYRNKRKIQLDVNTLEKLFSGDADIAKSAIMNSSKDIIVNEIETNQMSLFEKE